MHDLASFPADLILSRRALRRVVTQAFAIIVLLLALALAIEGPAETARPWSVRIVAFTVLVLLGIGLAEGYIRLATRLWPSGEVPTTVNTVAAVLGSIIGFTVVETIAAFFNEPLTPITWIVAVDVLIAGPVWILLIGAAVLARWRYLTERDSLMVELIRTEALRREESGLVEATRQSLRQPISDSVTTMRAGITEQLTRALSTSSVPDQHDNHHREALDAAEVMRRTAHDIVRPLSHAVWQQADLPPSPRQPLRFLARVIATQPFRPGLVAAVYTASALATNVALYGIGAGTFYLATDVAFIIAILTTANVAMRRWGHTQHQVHTIIYLATLLIIHVLPLLPKIAGLEETSPQDTAAGRVAEILISTALIVGTSSLGLLREGRQARLAALRREVDVEWLKRAAEAHDIAAYARSLAAFLHGPVQSTLITAAAAIDSAVNSRDAQAVARTLAEVTRTLEQIPDLDTPTRYNTHVVSVQLQELAESWRELCTVNLTIDPTAAALSGPLADAIITVVREATTNAYRHGHARTVDVTIAVESADIAITIIDDGRGPAYKIWGLGLTTIDRASNGRWTLTRQATETVLSVAIPNTKDHAVSTEAHVPRETSG